MGGSATQFPRFSVSPPARVFLAVPSSHPWTNHLHLPTPSSSSFPRPPSSCSLRAFLAHKLASDYDKTPRTLIRESPPHPPAPPFPFMHATCHTESPSLLHLPHLRVPPRVLPRAGRRISPSAILVASSSWAARSPLKPTIRWRPPTRRLPLIHRVPHYAFSYPSTASCADSRPQKTSQRPISH